MTNKQFSTNDEYFKKCCEKAGISPTKRQAGKFRRKTGLAYRMRNSCTDED
jgi:predicted HicB family RNase H-like nuclease